MTTPHTPTASRAELADSLIARLKAFRGPHLGDGINPGIHRDELLSALAAAPEAGERSEWPIKPLDRVQVRLPDGTHVMAQPVFAYFDAASMQELADLAAPLAQAAPPADLAEMEARKDAAYLERNQVVAALAKCFPSGVARTAIEGWSDDWHGCVYIDLPTGQASWHFHDSQAYLFDGLPLYTGTWDGHDTPEKYRRLAALATQAAPAERTFCNGSTKFDEGRSEDWKNGWWAGNMEGRSQAVLDTAAQLSAAIRYGDAREAAALAAQAPAIPATKPAVTIRVKLDPESGEYLSVDSSTPTAGNTEDARSMGAVSEEVTPEMAKAAADAWLDCGSKLILNKARAALVAGIKARKGSK